MCHIESAYRLRIISDKQREDEKVAETGCVSDPTLWSFKIVSFHNVTDAFTFVKWAAVGVLGRPYLVAQNIRTY
jgi:hypothetical protein